MVVLLLIAWILSSVSFVGPGRAGVVMSIVCVWSIWRYLDEVGFGPGGGINPGRAEESVSPEVRKAAESLLAYLEAWLQTEPPKANQRHVNAADLGFP